MNVRQLAVDRSYDWSESLVDLADLLISDFSQLILFGEQSHDVRYILARQRESSRPQHVPAAEVMESLCVRQDFAHASLVVVVVVE